MKRTKPTRFEEKLNNYIIAILLLIVTVPPIEYMDHKHTEAYKNLMSSIAKFEETMKEEQKTKQTQIIEAIIPTVHAESIPVEEAPKKITIMSNAEVKALIEKVAKQRGVKYTDYLYRLATCENKRHPNDFFDASRTNVQGNFPDTSVDRGLFMINNHWHKEVPDSVAFDPEAATNWTITRIEGGYQSEWMCDPLVKKNPAKYRVY